MSKGTIKPEAILEVRFKTTAEGGRQGPVFAEKFRCPMIINEEFWDCCLFLNGRQLELGETYQVPVAFLSPDVVLPMLSVGKAVKLWDGKDIAEGKVIELPERE
jgi:hypothetical protein